MSVCVEHLNRCKTSIYHQTSRGRLGILGVRGSTKLLKFAVDMQSDQTARTCQSFFRSNGKGPSRQSPQPFSIGFVSVRFSQSDYDFHTGLSFSPFQNSMLHY